MHQLRKENEIENSEEQNLTTADIASERMPPGPKLVDQERARGESQTERARKAQDERAALFPDNEVQEMRSRWDKIQTGFVDEPRQAVKQADELVASAIKRIAEQFARERGQLEQQWDRGDNVSTEDLRQALRRYRAFFDRLLSV